MGCMSSKATAVDGATHNAQSSLTATGGGSLVLSGGRHTQHQAENRNNGGDSSSFFVTSKGGSYIIGKKETGSWEPGSFILRPENTTSTHSIFLPIYPHHHNAHNTRFPPSLHSHPSHVVPPPLLPTISSSSSAAGSSSSSSSTSNGNAIVDGAGAGAGAMDVGGGGGASTTTTADTVASSSSSLLHPPSHHLLPSSSSSSSTTTVAAPISYLRISYACHSKQGKTPHGPSKPNQDSFLVLHQLGNDPSIAIFAVFDGHGPRGEEAAQYARVNLPDACVSQQPLFSTSPFDAFISSFEILHKQFIGPATARTNVDASVSGTTAIAIMFQGNAYVCANVGDSRAMVASRNANLGLVAKALSSDHKPQRPDEHARITRTNAKILSEKQLGIEGGDPDKWYVCRVHNGSIRYGVLFTRSIGDADAHAHLGLTATPEVKRGYVDASKKERFMVIASDGVWDFLGEDTVARIVATSTGMPLSVTSAGGNPENVIEADKVACDRAQRAADALVSAAQAKWESESSSSGSNSSDAASSRRRDDITVIVLMFREVSCEEAAKEMEKQQKQLQQQQEELVGDDDGNEVLIKEVEEEVEEDEEQRKNKVIKQESSNTVIEPSSSAEADAGNNTGQRRDNVEILPTITAMATSTMLSEEVADDATGGTTENIDVVVG